MKKQAVCEVYRDQSQMLTEDSVTAIGKSFENQCCVIAFVKNEFHMFNNQQEFNAVLDMNNLDEKCKKLQITQTDLSEFSEAVDFIQSVSKQTGCKIFIVNF